MGLRAEKLLGAGGEARALVRKKLVGLTNVSLLEPSAALERFGERKMDGSIFSESLVSRESKSKVVAFCCENHVCVRSDWVGDGEGVVW